MKMEKLLIGLMAAGMLAFMSCNYAGNSSGGSSGGNSGGSSGGSGNNSIPPKDKLTIGSTTYENTAEVQLMTTSATVDGSDEYNPHSYYTGAFPKGRKVTISPFIMGKYEVTQELYEAVMTGQKVKVGEEEKDLNENPSYCTLTSDDYKNMLSGEEQKYRPVEGVTWYDACYFCNALSEKLGLTKAYTITVETVNSSGNITKATVTPVTGANGYRLPTEAEWEYAARGGEKATAEQFKYFFSGATTTNYYENENSDLDKAGWYWYNIKTGKTESEDPSSGDAGYGTHQVGKKDANAAGLCDMSGNVYEWCYDWYDTINTTETVNDPSGPSEAQSNRVIRGGGWRNYALYCAVSYRTKDTSDCSGRYLGFRVVRNAE